MARTIEDYQRDWIMLLVIKVEEVLSNNDWPTEEGQDLADGPPSRMREIISKVREAIQ